MGSKFSNVSRLGTTKFTRVKVVTVVSGVITVVRTKFSVTVLGRAKVSNGCNRLESSNYCVSIKPTQPVVTGLNQFQPGRTTVVGSKFTNVFQLGTTKFMRAKVVTVVSGHNGREYKVHCNGSRPGKGQ